MYNTVLFHKSTTLILNLDYIIQQHYTEQNRDNIISKILFFLQNYNLLNNNKIIIIFIIVKKIL